LRVRDDVLPDEGDLSLAPLIDVVFLLLVFFMVATTYLDEERQLDVELPGATTGNVPEREADELVIDVLRDGRIAVRGETLDAAALDAVLADAARASRETAVTIRGDRLVHHEDVVSVMDACGRAGLVNLAVGTLER
jgi:biopolymer transport protein ExbD